MTESKYLELDAASITSHKLFEEYEQECYKFISDFRRGLVAYLGCNDGQVMWIPLTGGEYVENFIEIARNGVMALYDDTFYSFAFVIRLDVKNLLSWFWVKKDGDNFVVRLGDEEQVIGEGQQELTDLIEWTFTKAKIFLETKFDRFLEGQGKSSQIGFGALRHQEGD